MSQRFAIAVSRFNDLVTSRLKDAAVETLKQHGVADDSIDVVDVPGAFELPLAAKALAESGRYTGVVCLGAVIQGQTTHHEYINSSVASALMNLGLEHGLPIAFGVLTVESLEQALNRAGGKYGNKGREAAEAALEMAGLLAKLKGE